MVDFSRIIEMPKYLLNLLIQDPFTLIASKELRKPFEVIKYLSLIKYLSIFQHALYITTDMIQKLVNATQH